MLQRDLVVGRAYVNEEACVVRELVEELDERRVRFNAFDLETGKLLPSRHQVSDKGKLARWANREASASELARIHPFEPRSWSENLPDGEAAQARLEQVKADLAQTAAVQSVHRW
jgi:hypothetical protein